MLWKLKQANGIKKIMKTPSTYDDDIEDTDKDSYTSTDDASLIDNPIAVGMLKCNMSWDLLTEEEAEELLQATYKNPMIIDIKAPSVPGGMLLNAEFRCSKRKSKMHKTGLDEDTSKSYWQVSFNLMQKRLTEQQKQAVQEANDV